MTRFGSVCLVVLGIVVITSAQSASADDSEWETRRDEQRKSYEALMDNVPLLPQTHAHQVMRLRVEDKVLALRTPLMSTNGDGYARVRLDGMNAFALVRVQGGADTTDGEIVSPLNFQFTLNDYSQPLRITTYSVTSEQTYLTISKSVQFDNGYSNVQLIERIGSSGYAQTGVVQLIVSESIGNDRAPTNISVEAPDFFNLMRGHAREVNAYLRPLLRELSEEEALAPDPLVAWQVFSDRWHADAAATRKVQAILPMLDADNFRDREQASRQLDDLGRAGAAVMVHLDRKTLTPEQNARIDRALWSYAQLPEREASNLRTDPAFLLDCLNCDELPLREAACDRLVALLKRPVVIDLHADGETRSAAVSALRREILIAGERPQAATD